MILVWLLSTFIQEMVRVLVLFFVSIIFGNRIYLWYTLSYIKETTFEQFCSNKHIYLNVLKFNVFPLEFQQALNKGGKCSAKCGAKYTLLVQNVFRRCVGTIDHIYGKRVLDLRLMILFLKRSRIFGVFIWHRIEALTRNGLIVSSTLYMNLFVVTNVTIRSAFTFRRTNINSLGSGVYEAIAEGVTTSVVKLPLERGMLHVLYAVAVDNVGNSQSLQDINPTILNVPNGIYLRVCLFYFFVQEETLMFFSYILREARITCKCMQYNI